MEQYPSITYSKPGEPAWQAHLFDKLDGTQLRFEWSSERGWYKFGTKTVLFDASHQLYGPAIPMWFADWADPVALVAKDRGWPRIVAFAEWWSPRTIAGRRDQLDQIDYLTLFDVWIYRRGMLPPSEFLALFGQMRIPRYFGQALWTPSLVELVRTGGIPDVLREGIVGKGMVGRELVMRKAKTQVWFDAVHALYDPRQAREIINS